MSRLRCQRLIQRWRRSCGDHIGVPDALCGRARSECAAAPGIARLIREGWTPTTVFASGEAHLAAERELGPAVKYGVFRDAGSNVCTFRAPCFRISGRPDRRLMRPCP